MENKVRSLAVSGKSLIFAVMKLQKYILIEIIMMAIAIGGLILLTDDYIMSLGIVILLVIAEHLLVSCLERRKEEKEAAEDETADRIV